MDIKETLNETIENSVNDALASDTDSTTEDTETVAVAPDATTDTDPVVTDVTDDTDPVKDDFEARFGLQGQSFTGKENRIPYSRVKKIVAKAEAEAKKMAEEAIRKQLEGEYTPRVSDYETKIKNYEEILQRVAAYENMLEKDPQTFLKNLSQHPAYKDYFDQVNQLMSQQAPANGGVVRDPATGRFMNAQAQQQQNADPMPQPDKQFPDGSIGYSEEGLRARLDWESRNVENRIIQRIEQRFAPIEQDWQAQRRAQEMIPHIEKQVAEARTWDRFVELEPEIVQLLKQNPSMSIERAYMITYQKNVVPKMAADRNTIRQEVLAELKKTPAQTAAPVRNVKPAPVQTGPRDIADIIREEMEKASQ